MFFDNAILVIFGVARFVVTDAIEVMSIPSSSSRDLASVTTYAEKKFQKWKCRL